MKKGAFSENLFLYAVEGELFHKINQELTEEDKFDNVGQGLRDLVASQTPIAMYYVAETVFSQEEYECKIYAPYLSKYPLHLSGKL